MKKFLTIFFVVIAAIGVGGGIYYFSTPKEKANIPVSDGYYEVLFKDDNKVLKREIVKEGSPVSKPTDPKKDGYTFIGWYNSDGISTYNFNNYINSKTTIYAKWKANTYTVSFDYNGGNGNTKNIKVTYGQIYGELPTATREGYTFDGWYTKNKSGEKISSMSTYKTSGNITLYAHWVTIRYTITYNYNGGNAKNPTTYDSATESIKINNPTKEGYNFVGWTGTGLKSTTKSLVIAKGTSGNLTFTANWEAKKYTITFNANGGTVNPSKKEVPYESSYGDLPLPVKKGFTFDGWYSSDGVKITKDSVLKTTSNQTLSAKWSSVKYTITYNYNGGNAQNPAGYNADTDTFKLKNPTRSGYTFTGWTGTGLKSITKDVEIKKGTTGNLSFTANWTAGQYNVTFDGNGGNVSASTKKITYKSKYGTLSTASRNGYTFTGWYTAKTGGSKVDQNAIVNSTSNHTLYARWSVIKYSISYNYNGGSASNPTTYTVETNTFSLKNPTRTGYTFTGWTSGSAKSTSKNITITKGTYGNLSYTANWSAVKYTVTFNGNGGSASQSTKTVTFNDAYRTLPTATRAGYTFNGWYTAKTGGSKVVDSTIVKNASNHTLYAQWSVIKYTLDLNGVLDGTLKSNLSDFATADVYINGKLVKSSVQDYAAKQEYGTTYEFKNIKAKTGYSCSGVASGSKSLSGKVNGDTLVNINCKTLTVTTTFDANGGSVSPKTKTYNYGATYGTLPTPTRASYTFLGWYTAKTGGSMVTATTKVSSSNHTLYARWSAIITITFNKNGASSIGKTTETCTPAAGSTSCTITTPTITPQAGFSVIGWNTDATSTTYTNKVSTKITVSKNTTYYAITRSNETIKVTFWPGSGKVCGFDYGYGCVKSSYTYNGSNKATVDIPAITLKTPAKQSFKGWSTVSHSTTPNTPATGKVTFTNNASFYAYIVSDVTVTFAKNGLDSITSTSAQCVSNGGGCKIPASKIPRIYSKGNQVNGFSYYPNNGIYRVTDQNLTSDTTFYARIGNDYRSTLSISRVELINGVAFEVENSSNLKSKVIDTLINNSKEVYKNMPFLFDSRVKVNLVSEKTYNNTFGSDSAGMTYGYVEYPNIDVSISYNYYEYDNGCIIHELGHAWDDWYKVSTGTALSAQPDIVALYKKYKAYSPKNRPLRDYSYTNEFEFVAEMTEYYYYYKYRSGVSNPNGGNPINKFGNDLVNVFEKYVKMAKNGYK